MAVIDPRVAAFTLSPRDVVRLTALVIREEEEDQMKFNWSKVLSIVSAHPEVEAGFLAIVATNLKAIPALLAVTHGASWLGFVKSHTALAKALLHEFDTAIVNDPTLFDELLTAAVDATAAATGAQ